MDKLTQAREALETNMTDDQIKHMVSRFLAWKLPESFAPDGGISFTRIFNEHTEHPMKAEPSGTNLFDGSQAEAMVRHMVDGLPAALSDGEAVEPVADGLPRYLWLGCADEDNEHDVWFDPDEGGTKYVRADLASPPDQSDGEAISSSENATQRQHAALRERVAELEAENLRLRGGCPIEAPCDRLVRMAKAHTDASKRARTAEARATEGGQNDA